MSVVPILAHGGDLLILPVLIGAVVAIWIALKDGRKNHTSMPMLPTHPFARQVRAAIRVPAAKPVAPAAGAKVTSPRTGPPLRVVQGGNRERRIPPRSA